MDRRPIGVFDSGIGGLTVVKEIMKILPEEDIVYFGDTARVPYGSKSRDTIIKFAFQDSRFLLSKNVKAIVVACNTASAMSLGELQESIEVPVIGVIKPGAHAAVRASKTGRIGIIGTEGTIGSRAYENAIKKLYPEAEIIGHPCPLFVPLVEEGWAGTKVSYLVAEEYLKPLKDVDIDTLVMGCTHYPLLTRVVGDVMGQDVTLINPAEETALELKEILMEKGLQNDPENNPSYRYYVSDNPDKFSRVGSNFLNRDISNIQKVDIEKY
ncbi:glutamate racemase [Fonticella tunisiensis]|uniref:Glutamate racemase n=1 Tax=Fonticella tunisiensis TaxID=1096341 RepID=A0A4V3EV17_9CLOT|nr:glutamate racemase [Fonticella tunisiensis]TDT62352.1 glutamate racemase [Fonticella tunisiensis]